MQLIYEHIHYRCVDMEKTAKWYQDVMGAELYEDVVLAGNRCIRLRLGGTVLAFFPAPPELKDPVPATKRLGAYHIAFFVENHDEAVAYYKSRGAVFFKEGIMASPTLKVAFIDAPDGMQVELMEKLKG